MGYYSYIGFCEVDEVELPTYGLFLEHGPVSFNIVVDKVDEFETVLHRCGVRIVKRHDLDEPFDESCGEDAAPGLPLGPQLLDQDTTAYPAVYTTTHAAGPSWRGLVGSEDQSEADTGGPERLD